MRRSKPAMRRSKPALRRLVTGAVALVIVAALAIAFRPQPVMVDLDRVTRGPIRVTIDEAGRTRVAEAYIVATPVAGRLQRLEVEPGDPVTRGETIVAHMLPINPAALDIRTREQAAAAAAAAEAGLRLASADLAAAMAREDLAESELARAERLAEREVASEATVDRARQEARIAAASVETAIAAIAMREAELANARARMTGFEAGAGPAALSPPGDDIPIRAPADGAILRVFEESETTLPAGAPIVEIGDVEGGLEAVVELLSSDAVQVAPGDRVIIEDWGGPEALSGEVIRVDPFAVTKVSALGVEEQRVPVTLSLDCPAEARCGLGHGFRVETRIVVWEAEDALRLPASALFRAGEGWAVFVAEDGRAVRRPVEIGRDNGVTAEVRAGLSEGERVILYPSAAIEDGSRIAERRLE